MGWVKLFSLNVHFFLDIWNFFLYNVSYMKQSGTLKVPPLPNIGWVYRVLQQYPSYPSNKRIVKFALLELELTKLAHHLKKKFPKANYSLEELRELIRTEYNLNVNTW